MAKHPKLKFQAEVWETYRKGEEPQIYDVLTEDWLPDRLQKRSDAVRLSHFFQWLESTLKEKDPGRLHGRLIARQGGDIVKISTVFIKNGKLVIEDQ